MTIESKIDILTAAINRLTDTIGTLQAGPIGTSSPTPMPAQPQGTLVQNTGKAAVAGEVTTAPLATIAAVTPTTPAPTFMTGVVPFADKQGFVEYVMASYKALGPVKGSEIQNVLVRCGFQNINEVPVEKFADVHAGIEALKTA